MFINDYGCEHKAIQAVVAWSSKEDANIICKLF